MTVSQARQVFPTTRGNYDTLVPLVDTHSQDQLQYLQVPSDQWAGGYPSDGGGEIPCRRMRSGSYIKAMGEQDSVESDASPQTSPKTSLLQRDAFTRSSSMEHRSCNQCTESYPNRTKSQPRSHTYTRSLTSTQVCELYGVEALDLPGVFRSRSHSYVRAIQAGCSHDDDCLSVFSMTTPQGGAKTGAVFPYRRGAPPPLPPRMSRSSLSVWAQSPPDAPPALRCHGRPRQHSHSTESLDLGRGPSRELVPYGGPPRHSSSAGSLLEGPSPRGPLGKAASLPHTLALKPAARGPEDGQGTRKWRASIAVQVDSSETLSDSDEGQTLREVHSVGVQVEDNKRQARFKRSNSVTASVQADLDAAGFPGLSIAVPTQDKGLQFGCSFQRHSSEPESASQYAEYHRTVHTQGQWAYREDYLHGSFPTEPPQARPHPLLPQRSQEQEPPWGHTSSLEGPRSLPDPCPRDGEAFLRLLQVEVERLESWCQTMEREAEDNQLPGEVLEMIRSAVGSAQILMSQKVQQFFHLCQQSLEPGPSPPSPQELGARWGLLQDGVEEVRLRFLELQQLKEAGWRSKEDNKAPPPLPKKPPGGVSSSLRGDSLGEAPPLRATSRPLLARGGGGEQGEAPLRGEARRRLLQAKRSASFRQNSATESADSIEIFIPEAQTRL